MKYPVIIFAILCLLFSGCQATSAQAMVTITNTPFRPLPQTPTPSVTPLPPTPTASPTPEPCRETGGKVEQHHLDSQFLEDGLTFRVYSPPCFTLEVDPCYPLLVFLHGQTFNDDQWDRLGADEAADRLIGAREAPPFLIAMPYEEDAFVNPIYSGFGKAVVEEMLPWMVQEYAACDANNLRAIGGLSRGGGWAVHLGFTNWPLFGSIGAHSTPPFLADLDNLPQWVRKIPGEQLPRIYMDVGNNDVFRRDAAQFEALLLQYGVSHEWLINEGDHLETYWQAHVEDYLRWYVAGWVADSP